MLTNPAKPSFYYVELIGLSVGGKNLPIPPSTFTDTGTIIYSSTVITYLPSSGYSALRDEFSGRWQTIIPWRLHCQYELLHANHRLHVLQIIRCLLSSDPSGVSAQTLAASSGNKLTVVHRHGPCSPIINTRQKLNHRQILHRDQARVISLHNGISAASRKDKSTGVTVPDRVGISFSTSDYIVTVGFGTPKKSFSVIFDTGSDISWIQCRPCAGGCYSQNETLFDPSQSSTYANISCSSAVCLSFGSACDASSTCIYAVRYGDNSSTVGFLAQETLTLTPSNVLTNFEFGCGEKNKGLFGSVAGLVGLGRGEVSLASQAAQEYGGVFSYCLPPRVSSTGYLTLGASGPAPNVRFTPILLTNPAKPSFYYVELIGLSVGGKNLPIPPSTFTDTGTIIDSGTVITYLPSSGYSALRDEFRRQMANYSMAPPLPMLDTCYNFTGVGSISLPSVGLRFSGGVTLDVDPSGILYPASISQACLAFSGNSDPSSISIIGNTVQRTYDIVYDVARGMIGFGAGGCS
ncbi:aspartyl protease AED1-like [Phoenix dactylifera]|uniref:Aspartyl protease AED1-like n=1 Tax=Phoenix dactylifera TaxID=42345 RepID=A0A8B9A699_PHODC|nr:aspartyl protease AED1-like [Phoenix dactylifera]